MVKLVPILFFLLLNSNLLGQLLISDSLMKEIKIKNMSAINTPGFEFSPAYYEDGIAFVYAIQKKKRNLFDKKKHSIFFDLGFYFPDISGFPYDSTIKMQSFDKELNSEFHEGPMCFFNNTCFFTREHVDYKLVKRRKNKQTKLQIYKSTNENNNWSPSKILSFCNPEYNYCHPTISTDGNIMIFSSDKPGGYGKMDLYITTKSNAGWSEPNNLGANINSIKNDWFAFYLRDSLLLFASSRHKGIGGLDIYISQYSNNLWSTAMLLPKPFNTGYDDFGLIINQDGKSGYFSSSRIGGVGADDIYSFQSSSSIMFDDNMIYYNFTLMDSTNQNPIVGAEMNIVPLQTKERIFNIKNYELNLTESTKEGNFLLELSPKTHSKDTIYKSNSSGILEGYLNKKAIYIISFSKPNFIDYNMIFEPAKSKSMQVISLIKTKKALFDKSRTIPVINYNDIKPTVYIPTNSGAKMTFNNIYFGSNQYKILTENTKELDALAQTMLQNLDMKIILNAHTDAIGSEEFNLILSQKRADATKQYLVKQGVLSDQIISIGMGEAELLNHCKNGVKCSEVEHKINRRTEVEVL